MTPLLLVATWKAVTVPVLVACGVFGFLARGFVDMSANWENGIPDSRKAARQAFAILIAFVAAAVLIGLFGCSHLIVAPKPVTPHAIAFSGNTQNAGIVDCGKDGCLVTGAFVAKYRQMEAEYKQTFDDDRMIMSEGVNYRMPYDCIEHFTQMKAAERGSP
jgi:hypothetical protein